VLYGLLAFFPDDRRGSFLGNKAARERRQATTNRLPLSHVTSKPTADGFRLPAQSHFFRQNFVQKKNSGPTQPHSIGGNAAKVCRRPLRYNDEVKNIWSFTSSEKRSFYSVTEPQLYPSISASDPGNLVTGYGLEGRSSCSGTEENYCLRDHAETVKWPGTEAQCSHPRKI
jgi:hypothetical protein